ALAQRSVRTGPPGVSLDPVEASGEPPAEGVGGGGDVAVPREDLGERVDRWIELRLPRLPGDGVGVDILSREHRRMAGEGRDMGADEAGEPDAFAREGIQV